MKAQTFPTLLALASGATATFFNSQPYKAPGNTYDKCDVQQSTGFNWGDLPIGGFSGYGGFNFGGFTCQNSFGGGSKRNLAARTSGFQEKCITGHASSDINSCPKISCGSGGPSSFTIDHVQVSVEYDCELEFHYGMDDGSSCKTKHSCSTGGTTVKNSQCAGARNVTVVLPNPPKAKPSCSIGFHSIGWNCPTSTPTPPKPTTTACYGKRCGGTTTTPPAETTPPSGCYGKNCGGDTTTTPPAETTPPSGCYGKNCGGDTTTTPPAETTPPSGCYGKNCGGDTTTPPAETTPPSGCYGKNCGGDTTTTPPAETTPPSGCYGKNCGGDTTTPPAETTPPSGCYGKNCGGDTTTPPAETTPPSGCYGKNCGGDTTTPPADTTTPPAQTSPVYSPSSPPLYQNTSRSYTPPTVATTVPQAPTSSVPYSPPSEVPCPPLLPSCLNTFLNSAGCSSNTDKDCYCPKSEFTKLVFDCLYAHGASSEEIYSAQTYFQGICAQYIPQNPALITSCPVTEGTTATYSVGGPLTTISYVTTITITSEGGVTTSVYSSAATIPEVAFSTITGSDVGLITGTPAPIVAATTVAPVTSGTGSLSGPNPVFTGAASRSNVALSFAGAAAAFAVLAL